MMVLVKFIGCSAIIFLLFQLFLANEKTFTLNRWLLLSLIPAAMLVSFISLPLWLPQESAVAVNYLPYAQNQSTPVVASAPSTQAIPTEFWILAVYFAITALLFAKKISALLKLINWTKKASSKTLKQANLILSEKVISPFSFGKYVFMHPSTYKEGSGKTEMIIKHELIHIVQKHHIDLALMEFISVICWFNPIVFMVKRAIVLNHEYLADQGVKDSVHPIKYKKLLLSLSIQNNPLIWTSAISSFTLKHRLTMLNKPLKKTTMRLRIAFFSLLALLIVTGFSIKINAYPSNQLPPDSSLKWKGNQNSPLDKMPEFKGGMTAFSNYVKKEAKYPLYARIKGIEGQVEVQFVVEKDGSVSNVSAASGPENGFEFLAERIIKNAPDFNPGMQNGQPIRVQMTIPLFFTLSKEELDSDKLPLGEVNIGEFTPNVDGLKIKANYSNGTWNGTVRDTEGNLLPGALIIVEGANAGTVTDINGEFALKSDSSATLIVSFKGYNSVKLNQN